MSAQLEMEVAATNPQMRGELADAPSLMQFMTAGHAVLTIMSTKSGQRFTFKFDRPKKWTGDVRPIFASVLSGSNNESDYTFLGTIFPNEGSRGWFYKHSAKSRAGAASASDIALGWMVSCINKGPANLLRQAQVWHEGRCGRCGRKLTVPESIKSGFGPECIGKMRGD